MAQREAQPLAYADELDEFWRNLLPYHRRALLVFAFADPAIASTEWPQLPADVRMRLVRGMHDLAELAVDCAVTLERAKAALESSPVHGH